MLFRVPRPSGHQFGAPVIRASRSQTKSHGFTYYDLHPCSLPSLLSLPLSLSLSLSLCVLFFVVLVCPRPRTTEKTLDSSSLLSLSLILPLRCSPIQRVPTYTHTLKETRGEKFGRTSETTISISGRNSTADDRRQSRKSNKRFTIVGESIWHPEKLQCFLSFKCIEIVYNANNKFITS